MDPDLYRLTQATADELRARPSALKTSSEREYASKLHAYWIPYAQTNSLPIDFAAHDARAITAEELSAFIVASKLGRTRSHTRDGDQHRTRLGKPLAPITLEGVLAALRIEHRSAGLPWAGDQDRIKDLRRGYVRTASHTTISAAPLTRSHLQYLFQSKPTAATPNPSTVHAHARAVAVALKIPLSHLTRLNPSSILSSDRSVIVADIGNGPTTTRCLRERVDDPVAGAACGHCHIRAWLREAPDAPYLLPREIDSLRHATRRLARRLPRAHFARDRVTVEDDHLWTRIALGLDHTAAHWMRMRAALLPMFAVGLRLDDMDGLHDSDVAFHSENVTISVVGKTEDAARPRRFTLVPEGGPMCPVAAMRNYDEWTRAYLASRTRWTPPLIGEFCSRPVDAAGAPGSRALYQATRIWLLNSGVIVTDLDARTRRTLTPHSARQGFASQAQADGFRDDDISEAMRHSRIDTTTKNYLDKPNSSTVDGLLESIAEDLR